MEVIGQLTKEMSPQQIEKLLMQTKQKLEASSSVPGVVPEEPAEHPMGHPSNRGSRKSRNGSSNDLYRTQTHHSSSDEELEDEADLSNRKGALVKNRTTDPSVSRLNGSAKNLSVRFDPSQVQTSPHLEHVNPQGRRGHGHHRSHKHREHHQHQHHNHHHR